VRNALVDAFRAKRETSGAHDARRSFFVLPAMMSRAPWFLRGLRSVCLGTSCFIAALDLASSDRGHSRGFATNANLLEADPMSLRITALAHAACSGFVSDRTSRDPLCLMSIARSRAEAEADLQTIANLRFRILKPIS
jgi:hypothetical protein